MADRRRVRLWRSAPWRRAPLLLLRQPVVAVAIAGASVTLGVASAAAAPYVSATGNAAVQDEVARAGCPWNVGPRMYGPGENTVVDRVPHLGAPLTTRFTGDRVTGVGDLHVHTLGSGPLLTARLMSRPGFADRVHLLAGGPGPGVWLPRSLAGYLGASVGGSVVVSGPAGQRTLPVTAVYDDDWSATLPSFWCSVADLLRNRDPFSTRRVDPVMLADPVTYASAAGASGASLQVLREWPVRTAGLTLEGAAETAAAQRAVQSALTNTPELPGMVSRAQLVRQAVVPTVVSVSAAAGLLTVCLVGAAARYWTERRRGELLFLLSRGARPAALAGKALLEVAPWVLIGLVAGWALATAVVRAVGPTATLSSGATLTGLVWTGVSAAAAVVVVLAVAAGSVRRLARGGSAARWRWSRWVPVEAVAIGAGAWLVTQTLRQGAVATDVSGSVVRVSPVLSAIPLLLVAGGLGVAVRVVVVVVRHGRSRRRVTRPAAVLAVQRLAAAPLLTALLLGSTVLPDGVFTYAATVSHTIQSNLTEKAHLYVGADVAARTQVDLAETPGLRARTTHVITVGGASLDGRRLGLLEGVDVDTFAREAYWRSSYADRPLSALLASVRERPGDREVPALLVGGGGRTGTVGRLQVADAPPLTVRVVATARHFPLQTNDGPVLVTDVRALSAYRPFGSSVYLGSGDSDGIVAVLAAAGARAVQTVRADTVLDPAGGQAVRWSFAFLAGLAAFLGLVGAAGVFLYLDARARSRRLSYVMLRRIGLTWRGHVTALVLELAGLLVGGGALGAAFGYLCARATSSRLDMLSTLPPAVALRAPTASYGMALGVVVAATVLAVAVAQRAAGRARPAQVVRE